MQTPSAELEAKDRAAIVAKQLNDFLYLYNRETELFVDKSERPSQIPKDLYHQFLEHARYDLMIYYRNIELINCIFHNRECDLEEVLIHQTAHAAPNYGTSPPGFQGVLKCIPNVPKRYGLKPPYKQNKLVKKVASGSS